jgi:hypothetical protein
MAEYSYNFTDFLNDEVNTQRFADEIRNSSIATTLSYLAVRDKCYVYFGGALSGGDETTLEGLVAAHTGTSYSVPTSYSVEDNGTSNTTNTSYQQKLRLELNDIEGGAYIVFWAASVMSSDSGTRVQTRAQHNDSTTLGETDWHPETSSNEGYGPISGFAKVTLTPGNHYFDLDFSSSQSGKTVSIRRASLLAMPN